MVLRSNHPTLQQPLFWRPLTIHQIENIKTPTDVNFSSNPCIGNNDRPPTAPKITASGTVHAGHPGVKAANIPPKTPDEFDLTEFIIFILFILNAIIAKLIPANVEITTVKPIDTIMYDGARSIITSRCIGSIDIVRK